MYHNNPQIHMSTHDSATFRGYILKQSRTPNSQYYWTEQPRPNMETEQTLLFPNWDLHALFGEELVLHCVEDLGQGCCVRKVIV